jgi:PTH1 family peptidyl-tRNA hydrolase
MKIIVGLGNPGREYAGTRHNVGFEVIDAIARKLGWTFGPGDEFDRLAKTKFDGLAMDGTMELASGGSEKLLLLKPTTYMNLSGRAVQAAKSFYQVTSGDLIIVLDEMALPAGTIRIRASGSDGGHNGLKDIQRALGTSQYPRLRIGIDAPPPRVPGRDYVLGRFSEEQRKRLEPAIGRGGEAVLTWVERGINAAMNRFNADADETKDKE